MKQVILAVVVMSLTACAPAPRSGQVEAAWDADLQAAAVSGDFQTLSFANVLENALKMNCVGCHSSDHARAGIDLTNYQSVFKARAQIADAVQSGDMPLRGTMDPQAKDLLLRWIAAGAPEAQTN